MDQSIADRTFRKLHVFVPAFSNINSIATGLIYFNLHKLTPKTARTITIGKRMI